jgi:hypothetical protein
MRIRLQATLAHGIAGAWYLAQGRALGDAAKLALGRERLATCAGLLQDGAT